MTTPSLINHSRQSIVFVTVLFHSMSSSQIFDVKQCNNHKLTDILRIFHSSSADKKRVSQNWFPICVPLSVSLWLFRCRTVIPNHMTVGVTGTYLMSRVFSAPLHYTG